MNCIQVAIPQPPSKRPSLPKLATPSPNRTTPSRGLSLFIPPTIEAVEYSKPSKHNYTPVASAPRPKLSLNLGANPQRTFTASGSLSRSNENSDITAKNTIANTHLRSINCDDECSREWTANYTFKQSYHTRSILKYKKSSIFRFPTAKRAKAVAFNLSPVLICSSPTESSSDTEDYCLAPTTSIEDYDDLSSPPSTTSSTDSEESESDNECKTPIDNTPNEERWAKAMPKWRKPKREWVWTLGGGGEGADSNVKDDLEYSGVKVWGEDPMMVEAV